MVLKSVNCCVKPYLDTYKEWVTSKPQVIADIEGAVRCLSYFTAGKFTDSPLVSELIYSMPNLLILMNDRLIYSTKYSHLKLPQFQSQIKIWLTVIEYTEALIEVSAQKLWGDVGKWIVIFIVQSLKALLRLILVHRNKERLIKNPPIAPLNREKLRQESKNQELPKEGFSLKRSGTVVRSVNCSGPSNSRFWTPLGKIDDDEPLPDTSEVRQSLIIAETLYIMKPLIHLTAFIVKGKNNWIPWTTALAIDLASIHILTKEKKSIKLTKEENAELIKRRINLLLYLVRSPFYDNCSKNRINYLLDGISNRIPLARYIAQPIAKYLPHWQETYFYMWSS